ncbi:MAG: hypothetical protein NVV82_13350 [Sporocytophaga sp.]|nr:hypothetical protein [Sporocytophaga sp.]
MKVLKLLQLIGLVSVINGCNESQDYKSGESSDSTQIVLSSPDNLKSDSISNKSNQKDAVIAWNGIEDSFFRNVLNPVTFSVSTNVYAMPDTTSELMQVLPFNTSLELIREGDIEEVKVAYLTDKNGSRYSYSHYTSFKWYEINLDQKKGYVKATDIVRHSLRDKNNNKFFVESNIQSASRIFKYSLTQKQFIDTINTNSDVDVVKPIDNNWKNVNILFRVSSIKPYCGGGRYDDFVVDSNDSLFVVSTSGYDNIEDITQFDRYESNVYFPVKYADGDIQFVDVSNWGYIYDTLKFKSFPVNITVPKEEVIIKTRKTEQAIFNSKKRTNNRKGR